MKYIEEYLNEVVKIKPLGKLTTKDDEFNGMSGEMVYIDGKCSDIFISHADYANWLEKQGEQKLTDKIEPKFHEGEWVVKGKITAQILDVQEQYYIGRDIDGNDFTSSRFLSNDKIHLWTIQDAKDGDVLFDGSNILLVKEVNNSLHTVTSYLAYSQVYSIRKYLISSSDVFTPATKEQCDLLFKKMKESGYGWNAEKKELKKIHVIDEGKAEMDYCFTKMMKGEKVSPAWSEEDETKLTTAQTFIRNTSLIGNDELKEVTIDWLKSIKDRVFPQNTWKPTDDQIKAIRLARSFVADDFEEHPTLSEILMELEEQLKKLKEE